MANAELDINKQNLIFKYPETYYLDIELMYEVDPDAGRAKFIKDKKQLEISLPITGLTEKTKNKIKAERAGYDASVKERLEKAGIMDITDYKEQQSSAFIPDDDNEPDLNTLSKSEDEAPENGFLNFVKDTETVAETDEDSTLTEVKYKYESEEVQPDDERPKVQEIGVVDEPKTGETIIAPQPVTVEQQVE